MAVHVDLQLLRNNVLALFVSMHRKHGWAKGSKPYKAKIINIFYPLYRQMRSDPSVAFFKSGEGCDWRYKLYGTLIDLQI